LIGGAVGVAAGYFGGIVDGALMRLTDYFLVIPDIPLMIIVAAVFGRSTLNIILIIALIYWTTTARLIRAQVHSIRERVYIRRAEMLGSRHARILWTHVIPQVAPLLVANTILMIANAIFAETYITFLGLGNPSTVSWGRMIQQTLEGGAIFYHAWWAILPPGIAVTAVVLGATLVGQGLEDALNPRLRVGHLAVRRFRLRPLYGELERE
jgi:peptide/nickel transport system permease protein